MSKKNFKRFSAFTMAAVLTAGSAMAVLAADDGVAEGTGKYEGTKEAPIPSVTLPTDAQMTQIYDYIADPNNLIKDAKDHGRLGSSADIDTDAAGILFKYDTDKYGKTSKKLEVESQNYKDVDVTVELKVKDGAKGDADIVYADSASFDAGDTTKKFYMAVTDADATNPKTAALPASGVVKLTQTVAGKPSNFELQYDTAKDEYGYKAISSASGWEKAGFALTGALNNNATWGKGVTFPTLVVTWSYAEHSDSVAAAAVMSAGTSIAVRLVSGESAEAAKITSVKVDGAAAQYSVAGSGAILINGVAMSSDHDIEIVYDGTTYTGTFTA